MIKAIIFDCFGVLTDEGFHAFRDEYLAESKQGRKAANQAMNQFNSGLLGNEEFIEQLANLASTTVQQVSDYLSTHQSNRTLFEFIQSKLKPQYKIGLLSNAGGDWLEELFSKDELAVFDDTILSYQHGVIKPDKAIFELAAQRLGVSPGECLLVDDNRRHVDGAKAVGMSAILYTDFPQFQKDIQKYLT